MVSLLLMRRFTCVRPTPAPPTRKKTSCRQIGFLAWLALLPSGPTSSSTGDCSLARVEEQACNLNAIHVRGGHGRRAVDVGCSVAKPSPITTVLGRVTRIGSVRS